MIRAGNSTGVGLPTWSPCRLSQMLLEIYYQVTINFLKTSFAKLVSRIRSDLWEKYQARELNKLFKQSLLLCVERDAFVVGWVRKVSFLWHRHCLTHCLIPIPAAKTLLHFVFKLSSSRNIGSLHSTAGDNQGQSTCFYSVSLPQVISQKWNDQLKCWGYCMYLTSPQLHETLYCRTL